jgi:DNA-binding YbaB/EbfC family protein
MIDIMNLMGKMKEVQGRLKEAQENLVNITATAEAGAGMVRATANGKRQIVKLEIDKDLVKPEDMDMMSDLVVAACNKALAEVEIKAREEMQKSTEGMMPNIPGMNFDGLF